MESIDLAWRILDGQRRPTVSSSSSAAAAAAEGSEDRIEIEKALRAVELWRANLLRLKRIEKVDYMHRCDTRGGCKQFKLVYNTAKEHFQLIGCLQSGQVHVCCGGGRSQPYAADHDPVEQMARSAGKLSIAAEHVRRFLDQHAVRRGADFAFLSFCPEVHHDSGRAICALSGTVIRENMISDSVITADELHDIRESHNQQGAPKKRARTLVCAARYASKSAESATQRSERITFALNHLNSKNNTHLVTPDIPIRWRLVLPQEPLLQVAFGYLAPTSTDECDQPKEQEAKTPDHHHHHHHHSVASMRMFCTAMSRSGDLRRALINKNNAPPPPPPPPTPVKTQRRRQRLQRRFPSETVSSEAVGMSIEIASSAVRQYDLLARFLGAHVLFDSIDSQTIANHAHLAADKQSPVLNSLRSLIQEAMNRRQAPLQEVLTGLLGVLPHPSAFVDEMYGVCGTVLGPLGVETRQRLCKRRVSDSAMGGLDAVRRYYHSCYAQSMLPNAIVADSLYYSRIREQRFIRPAVPEAYAARIDDYMTIATHIWCAVQFGMPCSPPRGRVRLYARRHILAVLYSMRQSNFIFREKNSDGGVVVFWEDADFYLSKFLPEKNDLSEFVLGGVSTNSSVKRATVHDVTEGINLLNTALQEAWNKYPQVIRFASHLIGDCVRSLQRKLSQDTTIQQWSVLH